MLVDFFRGFVWAISLDKPAREKQIQQKSTKNLGNFLTKIQSETVLSLIQALTDG